MARALLIALMEASTIMPAQTRPCLRRLNEGVTTTRALVHALERALDTERAVLIA